jgi:twitching motility protein PilT
MSQLEQYFASVIAGKSHELHLVTDHNPLMKLPEGMKPIADFNLNTAQIEALLGEVLSPAELGEMKKSPNINFRYSSDTYGGIHGLWKQENNSLYVILALDDYETADAPAAAQPADAAAAQPATAATAQPATAATAQPATTATAQPATAAVGRPTAAIDKFFAIMNERGASDLHMSTGAPPMLRLDGEMVIIEKEPTLTYDTLKKMLYEITPDKNKQEFEEVNDTDFAYEIPGMARFRCNVFRDRKGAGAVFRVIPTDILTCDDLNLPQSVRDLCFLSKGLVVVTGPTGSGKSTTLAAMVDHINKSRKDQIITIEDPIEFVHENRGCLMNQREVGVHTSSFKNALRAALREDPDIVLVGEMRDLETIAIAIETAETGHLVFGTLHTTTAPSTVDRIIDQFPADRQEQIRTMLSGSLKAVIAQTLCKRSDKGRVAALEILMVNSAVSNLIREGKIFQIPSIMQTAKAEGMVLLNEALFEHVKAGIVDPKEAYIKAVDKKSLLALYEEGRISTKGLTGEGD